ncbi:hypothetical protein AsAng_0011860 [Aureispira anguillae]|uniref:Uncharacterized protein n=1 Tax=Aureispira anguillae TaxID=2864201 RepID=A0A915YCC1_9BACT|nr:hypothetical protein AsAng_0011860 [Aureispira anguillae]
MWECAIGLAAKKNHPKLAKSTKHYVLNYKFRSFLILFL